MKAVATLALSAVAVNALNPDVYLTSFSQQLGLSQTAVQEAEICLGTLQNTAIEVVQLIQQNAGNPFGLLALIPQAEGIVENIQATLATDCAPFANDFMSTVFRQVYEKTGNPEIEFIAKQNLERYFPQLVQKVAQWAHYLAAGDDSKAGQTEAYIIQVLLGLEVPETLPVPQITDFTPFDEDKFLTDYFTSFFKTLGQNVDINSIKTCTEEIQSFAVALGQLIQQFPTLSYVEKLEAIKNFVVEVVPEAEKCQGAWEIQKMFFEKAMEAYGGDLIGNFLQTVDNLALNFPEYINLKQKAFVEINEGDYILAGENDAKSVQIIDGGRIFN